MSMSISIPKRRKRNGIGERRMSINKTQDNLNLRDLASGLQSLNPLFSSSSSPFLRVEVLVVLYHWAPRTGTASFLFFDKGKPLSHSHAFLPISTSSATPSVSRRPIDQRNQPTYAKKKNPPPALLHPLASTRPRTLNRRPPSAALF